MTTESRPFTVLAAILLGLIAIAHLLRAVFAVDVVVGDQAVPLSVSVAATIVVGGLSLGLWRESRS